MATSNPQSDSPAETTDISFIILSFNSEWCIDECLSSLRSALAELHLTYDIWVVENGSTDRSRHIVETHQESDPAIQLIVLDHNHGTTASRNKALEQCQGRVIVILDSDAYVNPRAIDHLLGQLKERSEIGIIAPKLIFPDGRYQLSVDQFPTVTRKLQRFLFLRNIESRQREPKPSTVDYAISAFWMMSRETFEAVGPLDERIFYAPEDVDYCLRVWKAGFQVFYDPRVSIVHDAHEKSRGSRINFFTLSHLKGLLYFFVKHRYAFGLKRLHRRLAISHES